jgi:uncharacterized protein YheU (UPF0270 family)
MNDFSNSPTETPPVEIPESALSADALDGIIESYIGREGTDYGAQEVSQDSKIERVRKQLARGEIKIVFDPDSESVTLMTKTEWSKALDRFN